MLHICCEVLRACVPLRALRALRACVPCVPCEENKNISCIGAWYVIYPLGILCFVIPSKEELTSPAGHHDGVHVE